MRNVIKGNFITTVDLPPDQILEAAKGNLDLAFVVGRNKEGKLYVSGSEADLFVALSMLRMAQKHLEEFIYEGMKP